MTKQTSIAIIIFPLFILCCKNHSENIISKMGMEGQVLPSFDLSLIDSKTKVDTKNIPIGRPFVIFFFSPNCPYCRAQTQDILENIKHFKNTQFYFITDFPYKYLKKFYNEYHLNRFNNIIVAVDYNSYFAKYLKIQRVPYLALYDEKKRLKNVFIGKVSTTLINKALIN